MVGLAGVVLQVYNCCGKLLRYDKALAIQKTVCLTHTTSN